MTPSDLLALLIGAVVGVVLTTAIIKRFYK